MAQTSNPYGFKLVYAKESNLSAGLQTFPIASGYVTTDKLLSADTGVTLKGIGSGDPVTFSSSDTANTENLFSGNLGLVLEPWSSSKKLLVAATNGNSIATLSSLAPIVGIFGGCSYQPTSQTQQRQRSSGYVSGTTAANDQFIQATVNDHPFMIWQVQTNGKFLSTYTSHPRTPIGLNFGFTYGTGMEPSTGQSTAQLFVTNTLAVDAKGKSPIVADNGVNGYFKIIGLAPIKDNNWTDSYVDVYVVINNHYLKPGTSASATLPAA